MTYPGGKNGAGVYQKIINHMPPHSIYVEPFLGGGAVMRFKKPSVSNIGIDQNADVIHEFQGRGYPKNYRFQLGCGITWLEEQLRYKTADMLIYADPPYVHSTRSHKSIYAHEMTDADHHRLLRVLVDLAARGDMVMLSGYDNLIYRSHLYGWNRIDYKAMTRGGLRDEVLWMNFDKPLRLHDYRYLGEDYRERERIKRKKGRWEKRLLAMPDLERQALIAAFDDAGILTNQRSEP